MKIRSSDGLLTSNFVMYVDDTRTAGNSYEETRAVSWRAASTV
jgi:hypothetical protein